MLRQPESTAAVRHQCMNPVKVAKYFQALHSVINDCQPNQIWNMDETGLQLDVGKEKKIVAGKGSRYLHMRGSGNRETITCIACVNAAGDFLPPHIIPKGKTLKALQSFRTEDAPTGTNWNVSDSGWTKQGIAKLWFTETFLKNIGPQRPQVLILDGHDSHNFVELIHLAIQSDVHIVELPAHTSHWLQPCDRTVFKPLKDYYNTAAQDMMSDFPGVVTNKSNFTGLFAKAWNKAVTAANIQSGFKACGIVPYNPAAIPQEAYLPNYMYSVESLLKNPSLLEGDFQLSHGDQPTASASADHNYHALDQSESVELEVGVLRTENECNASVVEVAADCSDLEVCENLTVEAAGVPEAQHTTEVIDVAVYAANCNKPNFSSTISPKDMLNALESSMEVQQLQCFRYCYDKGLDLSADVTFSAWKSLMLASSSLASTLADVSPSSGDGMLLFVIICNNYIYIYTTQSIKMDNLDIGLCLTILGNMMLIEPTGSRFLVIIILNSTNNTEICEML